MGSRCLVVVGAQWGDEGKGKIVDVLAAEAEVIARYQGGANAGHTVHVGGDEFILHQIPSGILHKGTRCLLGNGVVLDLEQFFSELERDDSDERYEATVPAPMRRDEVEEASRQERLERAVQALPDHQRVPLVLFHFEDMTYKEIAAALGISVAKVRTDIHRGREALKRAMTGIV